MNCADVRENLSLYIDNEVDENLKQEIKEHLNSCASCMKEFRELLNITALLRDIPDAPLPANFDSGLKTAIRLEKRKAEKGKLRARSLGSIAAVFVIGIFSLTMYNQIDKGAPVYENAAFNTAGDMAGSMAAAPPAMALRDEEHEEAGDSFIQNFLAIPEPRSAGEERDEAQSGVVLESVEMGRPFEAASTDMSRQLKSFSADPSEKMSALSTRDRIVVEYFFNLISVKLNEFDHRVVDFWKDDEGIWNFFVELHTVNEAGEAYTETYTYAGQDGELWIIELSSSTDTVY